MISMGAINDAGPAGGAAGKLDGGLDTLGAGIGEEHFVQIWYILEQPLGQHAGKRRYIELHEVRKIGIKDALERMTQRRMVPANRKNAKPAE